MESKIVVSVIAILGVLCVAPVWPQSTLASTENEEHRYVGEPIDLSLRDADLVETLRSFAEIGRFNLVLQPDVKGKVTVEFKQVPWDLALEQILKINNLGMEITHGNRAHIGSLAEIAALRIRLRTPSTVRLALQHADARVVAGVLGSGARILGPRGSAEARAGNELIVRDSAARLLELGRLLTHVDVPEADDETPKALEKRCLDAWRKILDE